MKSRRLSGCMLALAIIFALSHSAAFAAEKSASKDLKCFAVYGDSSTGHYIHKKIIRAIIRAHPIMVFHLGDLVEDSGNPEDWIVFMNIIKPLVNRIPLYPILGDHENDPRTFFDIFKVPREGWYWMDREGIRFILLNSDADLSPDSRQYKWLETKLSTLRKDVKFIIVMMHESIFSTGTHGNREDLKSFLTPLLEKYKVDIVFSAHDHGYERSFYNGIYYIVSGGGGAPLGVQKSTSPYSQVFASAHNFCRIILYRGSIIVGSYDLKFKLIDEIKVERKTRDISFKKAR